MPERTYKMTPKQTREAEAETQEALAAKERTPEQQDLLDSDILDEIDAVLESDAQAFVAAYVQAGGQ